MGEVCLWNMNDARDRGRWMQYAAQIAAKPGIWQSELTQRFRGRTLEQNNMVHSMLFPTVAIIFTITEGKVCSEEDAKRRAKWMWARKEFLIVDPATGETESGWEIKDTSEMDTRELSDFFEAGRDWCAGFGYHIHDPDPDWKEKGFTQPYTFEPTVIDEERVAEAVAAIAATKEVKA